MEDLKDFVERCGVRRALVATDAFLIQAGVVERTSNPLLAANVNLEVYGGGELNPSVHTVNEAVALSRDFQPDVIIGLGGGSNMDLAKAVATLLKHGGTCQDYAGDQVVPGPIFPLILLPTTAGTGSEVSGAAVLNDTEQGTKFGILSNYLRPELAVVDPMLTISCPAGVTADSGIDALTHAIESYTAVDNADFPLPPDESTIYQGHHPLGDVLAERAIELVGRYLRRAVADGTDLEAREQMALAATISGLSFSNVGVAAVHALEYTLAAVAGIPHGRGCGLLLPHVMRFNCPVRTTRMARVATLLGQSTNGFEASQAAESAVVAVEQLKVDIGIPARMRDVGVDAEHLPAMAEKAFALKRILRVNPRSVTQEDLISILRTAL